MAFHPIDAVIFFVFVIVVITIGVMKSRHEKDSESYFLAGRGLTWWLIGFSLIAANISAEQFVGMSGLASKDHVGLAIASYEWIAAVSLVFVAFFFLPKFLRSGIYTIPEFLEYRFNHTARTIMSILMVAMLVFVNITAVIYMGAKALEPLFEGDKGATLGITSLSWIVGIAAAAYVAAGGLKACAWTDLFWGSGLILGGAVVMVLTFMALEEPEKYDLDNAAVCKSIGVEEDASLGEKFAGLKEKKMHMILPRDNPELPWTMFLLGIWIPNLYYWGLNQYIMQRALGAQSLAEGQRGVVFAAGLKLIIPFIVCIPGVIAFSLFSDGVMREKAMTGARLNKPGLEDFEELKATPATAKKVFPFDGDFATLHPGMAREMLVFNATVAGLEVTPDADLGQLREELVEDFLERRPVYQENLDEIEEYNKNLEEAHNKNLRKDEEPKVLGFTDLNAEVIALATDGHLPVWRQWVDWFGGKGPDIKKEQELIGYDHDGAFPFLIRYLAPVGLKGFVIAALMGAVVSSLAAMLNAASTIFTMDVYREYINRNASQRALVTTGRICVPVAVLVGCVIAPQLARPELQGAFHFIQEFQGYISPGVLTVFLFGLFVPWTPRIAGAVGLVLCPITYGFLQLFFNDVAFLNRMAITAGVVAGAIVLLMLINPLREPVTLPEQKKFNMTASSGAKIGGVLVLIATLALYVYFW